VRFAGILPALMMLDRARAMMPADRTQRCLRS
jgi:hypothetical protein